MSTNKPYDDQKVRKAIQLAVDNATVLKLGYSDAGMLGENHHVCPIHPEYAELPKVSRDIAKAKALMTEAGQMDFEHELIGSTRTGTRTPPMSIAAQLREAGFKVKRTVLPGSTFWNDWTKYPFSMTNWSMRPLGVQVIALAYRTGEAWNESAYSNKELDKKIAKALTIADVDKRRELMVDIEKILQDSGDHHPALLAQDLQPLDEVGEELRHSSDLLDATGGWELSGRSITPPSLTASST